MKEGSLVIILGKMNTRIKEYDKDKLIVGTIWTYISEDNVLVLLPDGIIHMGHKRDIVLHSTQETRV